MAQKGQILAHFYMVLSGGMDKLREWFYILLRWEGFKTGIALCLSEMSYLIWIYLEFKRWFEHWFLRRFLNIC